MVKPLLLRRPVIQKVAKAISMGVPLQSAALVAGLTSSQLKRWMRKGAEMRAIVAETGGFPAESTQDDWMAAELHQEVELAHAKVVAVHARKVNAAAKKDWKAAAWWLQRRAKEDFGLAAEKDAAAVDSEKPPEEKEQFVFHCPENGRG